MTFIIVLAATAYVPLPVVTRTGPFEQHGFEPTVLLAWERAGAHANWTPESVPGFAFRVGEAPSPDDLAKLPAPAVPFALEFEDVLTPDHVRALGRFKQLRTLICYRCDPVNIEPLSRLSQLELLQLAFKDSKPTPADLAHLQDLPRLRELRLRIIPTSADYVSAIQGFRQIETLDLRHSDVTDDDLTQLSRMNWLRGLDLYDTKITGGSMDTLALFPALTTIYLDGSNLPPVALRGLMNCPQLRSLALFDWIVSTEAVESLSALTQLQELNLSRATLTDHDLSALARLKQLRVLGLVGTKVTDAGLEALRTFSQLTDLELNNQITDDGLTTIEALASLRRLSLPANAITGTGSGRITASRLVRLVANRPEILVTVGGRPIEDVSDSLKVNEAVSIADPSARIEALNRVRGRIGPAEARRADELLLLNLVKEEPNRADRIRSAMDRVIAAIPTGSSPVRKAEATLQAVERLADSPTLSGPIESYLKAALTGLTDATMRSATLAALGRAQLAQGRPSDARRSLEQSLGPQTTPPDRGEAPLIAVLAQAEARTGADAQALDHFITAAAMSTLSPAQEADARAVWGRVRGSDSGLEELVARKNRQLFPNPISVEPFTPSASRTDRVSLLELFTGSGCNPCLAADLAQDALLTRYPSNAVVAVAYHLHVPRPDPMTTAAGEQRAGYYGVDGTPAVRLDGSSTLDRWSGGSREYSLKLFDAYVSGIESRLEAKAEASISLNANISGDAVLVRTSIGGLAARRDDLTLHVLLVEREVGYAGENGIRQHPMVVRAMAGEKGRGIPVAGNGTTTQAFSLTAVRADVVKTLADEIAERRKGGNMRLFTAEGHATTAIDVSRLVVVAFVQRNTYAGDTPNVLQAAQVPVTVAPANEFWALEGVIK